MTNREKYVSHIKRCQVSGESASKYCRKHNLSYSMFKYYLSCETVAGKGAGKNNDSEKATFVDLSVNATGTSFIVTVNESISIAVPPRFDEPSLKRLLGALGCSL